MKTIALEQGSQEWLDFRRSRIGASDWPNITETPGSFSSREQVLHEKISAEPKQLSEFTQNIFARGHEIEAQVRDAFAVSGRIFTPLVAVHPENERLFASLDGYDELSEEILEVKSTTSPVVLGEVSEGKIPAKYFAQIQFQFFITGVNKALLVVVDRYTGKEFYLNVTRDERYISTIKDLAEKFLSDYDSRIVGHLAITHDADAIRLGSVVAEMKLLEDATKKLDDEKKYLAEKLLTRYNAATLRAPYLSIERVERQGAIDYKSIPELAGIDLEKYRKRGTSYVKVTIAKGN